MSDGTTTTAIDVDLNTAAGRALWAKLSGRPTAEAVAAAGPPGPAAMRRYTLCLDGITTPLNRLMRSVGMKMRLKKRDRDLVALAAAPSGIPDAERFRRVRLLVVLAKGMRFPDPDAWQKSLGDALVQCRLLVNDSAKWVEWMPAEHARGPRPMMFVTLEEFP